MKKTLCLLAVLGGLSLESNAAALQRPDACRQTTDSAHRSCRTAAPSDFWLAWGKCANVAERDERRACEQEASAAQKEALMTCDAQRNARQAVCRRIGGAPYEPEIEPTDFVAGVDNLYFPLPPGTTFIYEGRTPDGLERDTFSVTEDTRLIAGVRCVEVRDTVTRDGELIEDTLDWFAQDREGNVWYFGENAKQLAGGLIVGVEGSWTAGIDGARPGIAMKSHPAVGDFYRQEFSLGTAEDIGAVLSRTESVTVPYGSFDTCLKTEDTSPLDPESVEHKFYAPGIGAVLELDPETGERLELVRITTD